MDREADAGAGGTGAPPPLNEANRVPAGLTREYRRSEMRVQWFASRCIHSAKCVQALPQVFDPRRRPWIDINQSNADAIASAVEKCPTGALKYQRLDGGPEETASDTVQIMPVRNGPYFVRGVIELPDAEGNPCRETRVALCRCGQSKHMPHCDNTHRAIGFRSS